MSGPEAGAGGPGAGPLLSLVVNTRNEERNLPGLLASVEGVDEVVVADMESTDATVAVAEAAGARVVRLPDAGLVEPGRMPAIRAASGRWALVLDADERLGPGGVEALRHLCLGAPEGVAAYRLPFQTFIGGRRILGSGWGPDLELHARLLRPELVDWPPVLHSHPSFEGMVLDLPADGPVVVRHENFADLADALDRFNRYSTVEADQLVAEGRRPTVALALRMALEELVGRYDPEADGALSLALSVGMLGYRFQSHAKALERLGWDDPTVPGRHELQVAVGTFWSTLRTAEIARIRALAADDGGAGALDTALAVWGDLPPALDLPRLLPAELDPAVDWPDGTPAQHRTAGERAVSELRELRDRVQRARTAREAEGARREAEFDRRALEDEVAELRLVVAAQSEATAAALARSDHLEAELRRQQDEAADLADRLRRAGSQAAPVPGRLTGRRRPWPQALARWSAAARGGGPGRLRARWRRWR